MLDRSSLSVHRIALALVGLAAFAFASPVEAKKGDKRVYEFAAQMAQAGSWREATHRWTNLLDPDSGSEERAHLYNNLAVAAEALGNWDKAASDYAAALELESDNFHIQENQRRFSIFRERLRRYTEGDGAAETPATASSIASDAKRSGKVIRVTVGLPMPPRLKLAGGESILVISFLDDETHFLDINREMVRYLRSAFANRTAHEVLQVNPPPAVPEQTVEDLLANAEFWKYLHREYGADLIVSGVLGFDREDVSGYKEVDMVSSTTGQKVRQMRFVEQERFSYLLDIFFIDGPTGGLLFRDALQRSAVVGGVQNDPITTFFELSDTMADEVLAIITTRVRADSRTIFKY
jgi:tetratricopeptide (TPR) repeat protein